MRFLAVALPVLLGTQALAQVTQSDLPPIQSLEEPVVVENDWDDAPVEAAPPPMMAPAAIAPRPVRVQENNVPALSFDTLGLYPAEKKEKSWSAQEVRTSLDHLPPQIPAALRSPLTQALATEWPLQGEASNGALLIQRAELLARWGSTDVAQRLLTLVPATQGGEAMAWSRLQVAWLAGQRTEACRAVDDNKTQFPEAPHWAMAAILCRALDGRIAEAQLAIDLMDEQGQTPDPLVRHAVESLRLKKPNAEAEAPATLWNQIVLIESGGTKALEAQWTQLPTPILRRISTEAHEPALRKRAATRVAQLEANVSPGEWLTPVRMEIPADAPDWQRHEAKRTALLLQALGEKVNPEIAAALGVSPVSMEDAEVTALEASLANRQSRAWLLQLAALLPPDLATMEDGTLARIIQALQGADQRPLARQIAAEAIAAIGVAERPQKAAVAPVKAVAPKATPEKAAPKAVAKPAAAKPAKPAATKAEPAKAEPKTPPEKAKPSLPKINLP